MRKSIQFAISLCCVTVFTGCLTIILLACFFGNPIYINPPNFSDLPPGWIIQQNEVSKEYRWCKPMAFGNHIFYCSSSQEKYSRAVVDAWMMYNEYKILDVERNGWK